MILTFDYPSCYRKNLNDRRLWSEINTSLIYEQKKYDLIDPVVVVTVFKEKNLMHSTKTLKYNLDHRVGKRHYFSVNELENLINIILNRLNIDFNINKLFYREKDVYGKSRIKLEFLTKGKNDASPSN